MRFRPICADIRSLSYPPEHRPFLTLRGFQICSCLDNSTFFTDLQLELPNGITQLNDRTADSVVEYIDQTTERFLLSPGWQVGLQRETQYLEGFTVDPLQRGICFSVALGNLDHEIWGSFVAPSSTDDEQLGHRFLRTIDPGVALPFLNYETHQKDDPSLESKKPRYNLAYIILVHENIESVSALIQALDDPSVFIYIHVDRFSPQSFHDDVQRMTQNRTNMRVMPTSFYIRWGHPTILWAQIRGLFDLLDLIEFEYIINLSGADYPLKSAATIFSHLSRKPGGNWMSWMENPKDNWRTQGMFHCGEVEWAYDASWYTQCRQWPVEWGYRSWDTFRDIFPHQYKISQWFILHRSAVEYLRASEAGRLLMMWSEHTFISDEEIIGTIFMASPIANRVYRDPTRLILWDDSGDTSHPHEFGYWDKSIIERLQQYFLWIRKVNVGDDSQLREILDRIIERDEMEDSTGTEILPYIYSWET